ncbi:hypothetical protein HNR65_001790 [Desulfosalsimonas propionicica]|uniref:Uncharacterized protein n=1 Tax=Desulfosalsimonas propionicica TaxID=332175 RepID=A0A7W0HKQ9_9BACT|nr:hypothetical protein [Desulfosalsimonas propionicica]MBA2881463.1 hypothetical protein [Desulfosalsimonas propionicica]
MCEAEKNQIAISVCTDLSELREKVGNSYLSDHSLCLLEQSLSDNVQYMLLEYPYVDKDFRSTYYSDFSKRHKKIDRNSYRVHLFGKEEYFGFFTLRNTAPFNLGRAYIAPDAFARQKGHLLLAGFECHFLGKTLTVKAFPWMQQDANISRCAQVSIWAITRYYSEKYSIYSEYTIQQIFDLASSHTRKIPSKGLTIENISSIFSLIGFYPEIYFSEIVNNRKIFNEIIYIFVESGIPFVAGLRGKRHAIAIIGHLKIEPENDVKSGITPISDLIEGYFSVDDNCLPYSVVGNGGMHSVCDIDSIIVPLYEKMYLDVLTLLSRILPEIEDSFLPQQNMYRRVFMASSKSFKQFIFDNAVDDYYKYHLLLQQMPKFIWVAEYIAESEYPDYVQSRFIFDATAMEYAGIDMMISARIGSLFICEGESVELDDVRDPIYRHNLAEAYHGMDEENDGSQQQKS